MKVSIHSIVIRTTANEYSEGAGLAGACTQSPVRKTTSVSLHNTCYYHFSHM